MGKKRPVLKDTVKPPERCRIVVPSHRRANMLTTHLAVDIDAVCVAQSQVEQYRENYPRIEFVEHPDDVIGLHAKRQWMYEHFGSIMMFDDDVQNVVRLWQGAVSLKPAKLTPAEVRDVVNNLFHMAVDCDAYLFGFSKKGSPLSYRPFKPFTFSGGVMGGGAYGVRAGSKLHWNPRMSCSEDDWISALNAYHHRHLVVDNRFFAATHEYGTRRGGLTEFRNDAALERDVEIMQHVFGEGCFVERSASGGFGVSAKTIKTTIAYTYRSPF